ncbi:MAG TPA: tetratricopeptide repeat protein, partial [Roseiflexaceae bacterium]|nr:tetratricopeptide repeat protein [Roseiflexaceae bacterium]
MSRTTTTVATERALDAPDTAEQRWWAIEELRSQRPDLAKWIDTIPELGELLMLPAWRTHVDRLPNPSATPTSMLLDVWSRAALGSTPSQDTPGLPAPISHWLAARALALKAPDSWPGTALAPLVARCVYTLAPDRGAILAHLLVWRDRPALAACLAEPIGLADAQAYVDRQASLADALLLVDALLDAGAGSAVASMLERARQRWQRRPDVLAHLAQRAERAGLGERALRFAQETVALDPEQADARLTMARAALESGSHARAMQIHTDTLRATKRQLARVFASMADASRAAGEGRHARRAYAHAFACDPEQPRIAVALAELLFAEGRTRSARKVLERIGPAQSAEAACALVRQLLATGEHAAAAQLAAQTVERFPTSADAYLAQAEVARAEHKHAAARDALARAILAAPDWHTPRLHMADVLAEQGQDAQALAAYRSLLTIAPAHVPARHGQARMLARMGALDDAVQTLETLIASFPDEPLYYADLGAVHAAKGTPERAHQAYRRAWELAPGHSEYAQTYAQALVQRGEPDYALTVLGQAVAISPAALPLHRMRAGLYVQNRDYRSALGSYEQAFAAQPDAAIAVAAARVAHTLGERAQARTWLTRALRLNAALPEAWLLSAQLHEQEQRYAAAARRYERAMHLGAPRQHLLDVARVRERAGDLGAAAALLERVVAQGQQLDQALHALGMIRQRQGQQHEALALAHRFADLPAPASAPLSWAAETLADAGQHRAAIELLRPVLGQ